MTLREFLRRQADGAYQSPAKNVQARAGWCTYESDPDTLPEKLKQAARVLSETADQELLDGYEAFFLEKRWNADDPGSVYTVILLCPIGEGTPLRIVLDHPAYPYQYTLCKQADHHYIFVSDDPAKVMHKAASYLY